MSRRSEPDPRHDELATSPPARTRGVTGTGAVEYHGDGEYWRDHTRIFLRPVASPVVLGWLAWAAAAFVLGSLFAWGYGDPTQTFTALGPYVIAMGIAELIAAYWGFNARDTLVTGFHGVWGATWIGIGLLIAFVPGERVPDLVAAVNAENITDFPALGYMFMASGAAALILAPYGLAKNMMTGLTMAAVGVAATFMFIATVTDAGAWETTAGWVFLGAIVGAVIVAGATAVTYAFNAPTAYKLLGPAMFRGEEGEAEEGRILIPVEHGHGEPGVRQGEGARG